MANVNTKERPRGRQAYLNYDQIQPFIEAGKLDQYDEIFCKDRNIKVYIDKDLNPREIKSTNDVFNSEEDALESLNALSSDWFAGQLIAIRADGEYLAYTVNYNSETQKYSITPIDNCIVDYNDLQNIPIQNKVANAEDNLVLSELSDGYYNVLGTFKISPIESTTHIVTSPVMYVIKHRGSDVYVRPLDSIENELYIVDSQGEIGQTIIPTMDEVEDEIENYITRSLATTDDVDSLFD